MRPSRRRCSPIACVRQIATANCNVTSSATTPCQIEFWNSPAYAEGRDALLQHMLTDSWTIARTSPEPRCSPHDNGFVPASCREAATFPADQVYPAACFDKQQFNIWEQLRAASPRLVGHSLKRQDGAQRVAGAASTTSGSRCPRWTRPMRSCASPTTAGATSSSSGNYDPGEVNLNANGADFISQSGGNNRAEPDRAPAPRATRFHSHSNANWPGLRCACELRLLKYRDTYRILEHAASLRGV